MKREAKEKYAEISEAIEQAEKAEFDRILDNIASGSKKRLIRIRNNESDIEMIYLRCRRIAIVLEYFRFRTPKQNAVLKKDCDDVIKMIAFNDIDSTRIKAMFSRRRTAFLRCPTAAFRKRTLSAYSQNNIRMTGQFTVKTTKTHRNCF